MHPLAATAAHGRGPLPDVGEVEGAFHGPPGARERGGTVHTAARAEALCGPLTSAVVNVDNCKELGRTKKGQRATALRTLDRKTARVRNELEVLLDAKDPRWLKFFNRIPGDPRVPEPVENLTATAQPGGKILVDWDDAARAARYKVRKLVVGVDVEMVDADTVEDSDAVLENVPAGATVKLQIVPLNGAGAGVPSAVIEVRAA